MKRTMHYTSIIVKRKTGLGPKPRLKKQVKPCSDAQIREIEQKPVEAPPVPSSRETFIATTTTEENSKKDQFEEPVDGESEGGGNEPLNEIEPEEYDPAGCEPRQENDFDSINNDGLHYDGKEFIHTVLQHEDDIGKEPLSEIDSEDYDQAGCEPWQENDSDSITEDGLHHDGKGFIHKALHHGDDMESGNEPLMETASEEYDETGFESGQENDCGLINKDGLHHDGKGVIQVLHHEDGMESGDEPLRETESEEYNETGCESGQENDCGLINKDGLHHDGKELINTAIQHEDDVELGDEPLKEIETEEYDQATCELGQENDTSSINKDGLHHDRTEFIYTTLQHEDNMGYGNKVEKAGYSVDGFQANEDEAGRMADELGLNKPDKKKIPELFVGGLDKNATEDDVKKTFSKVGEVVNVKLMINPVTKKNQGYAFLQYATKEQANQALTELKNPLVNGKHCGVAPCKESKATLFLGNICRRWTEQKLIETLKSFGIKELKDLRLARDFSHSYGRDNCGFAFLEFSSHSDAMTAYKHLQKRGIVLGVDQPAKICFTDPDIQLRDETIAKVRGVFLDGLPQSWDDGDVKKLVRKYGYIEKIELALVRYKPSATRRPCGFVTFYSHEAAVACAKAINNAELKQGHHKVKIKAILSEHEKLECKHPFCRNSMVEQQPNSREVRYSTDVPTSRKLNPSMQSSCSGYKIALEARNKNEFCPTSRPSRSLPSAERSYKRKASASIDHKRNPPIERHYAANRYNSPPRKRHNSACGSHGKSYNIGYPLQRHSGLNDSCRGLSHPRTRRSFGYESCGRLSLRSPGSESQKDWCTDKKSDYGECYFNNADDRMYSPRPSYRSDYASSVHGGSHSSVFTRLRSGGTDRQREGFTTESPGSLSRNCCRKPVHQCCSFGGTDDIMDSRSYGSDYMSSVDGGVHSSVFSRLGPGGMSR